MQKQKHNRLVDLLPGDVYEQLQPQFTLITLTSGVILHRPLEVIRHLYFPLDCMISITIAMAEGKTVEAGAVGNREVVGINAFMGGSETTQTEYIVQVAGDALRIDAQPLLKAFDENKAVRDILLKYTQAMVAQISQNAGCNRVHGVNQRYARWLLEVRDRVECDDLHITQEFLAEMLGVRRPTITVAAAELQAKNLLSVERGVTHILDVEGLEGVACECYRVLQDEYHRLLGTSSTRRLWTAAVAKR